MMSPASSLLTRYFPVLETLSRARFVMLAVAGSFLLALSGKISVPFYPVPLTMQTFMVVVLGCALGSRLALTAVVCYLAEGFMGLPVFQGPTAGPLYFMGPTAGYLLGFAVAAYVVGYFFERGFGRTYGSAAALFALGALIIDVPGVAWLSSLIGFEGATSIFLSYQYGFLLKTGLGAFLIPTLWHHHSGTQTH